MQKEILTPSNCKKDLAPQNQNKFNPFFTTAFVMLFLLIGLLGLFLIGLDSEGGDNSGIVLGVLLIASGALPLIVYIIGTLTAPIRAKRRAEKIKSYENEFFEDTLDRAYEDMIHRYKRVDIFYVLSFKSFGRYRVPSQQHYAWSELYSMSPSGIYNTSIVGDTFYIAVRKDDPKKAPLWVYNAKLFELCPDGTTRKPRASWRDSVSLE
ncbi:MAG: hypothetical protein IJX47_01360 [Clostridia bacterium]|nr:hypothetical protein [Clostridia bacterium]